jgi:ankyrin repeat protein
LIYALSGSLGLGFAATIVLGKKIIDAFRLNKTDENVSSSTAELLDLKKEPTDEEQIELLINNTEIESLCLNDFNVSFNVLYAFFLKKKSASILAIIATQCVKKDFRMEKDKIQHMLVYCLTHKAYDLLMSLIKLCPSGVIDELFVLINKDELAEEVLLFIAEKKEFFAYFEYIFFINGHIRGNIPQHVLDKFITIFPDGELRISNIIRQLINDEHTDTLLFTTLLTYLNQPKNKDNLSSDLQEIITSTVYCKKLDLTQVILKNHPKFFSDEKVYANQLLFRYAQDPIVLEFLIEYGIDVNNKNEKGATLCEWILEKTQDSIKKQQLVDILLKNNVDLNAPLIDGPPQHKITLLGYLPFLNIKVNKKSFEAIRLQKFLTMFLEIPGTSISNGTLCLHGTMVDTHAYYNFILNLYFNNEFSSMKNEFTNSLNALYSDTGYADTKQLYEAYLEGKPIVMPIFIKNYFGSSHVATIGLLKVGIDLHLAIEADRGFGRKDYSVYTHILSKEQFYKYARSKSTPIYDLCWSGYKGNSIFSKKLTKQKDDFCPSISTKFAFHISYLLCNISKEIKTIESELTNNLLKQVTLSAYEQTKQWFNQFCLEMSTLMLKNYANLDSEYIDSNVLSEVKNKIGKREFDFEEIEDLNHLILN